jgi:hypothetical protein
MEVIMAKTIYQDVIAQNIQHANHCSDLYIPCNAATQQLVAKWKENGPLCVETFFNRVEGGTWYSIAFAYDPYWQNISKDL